MQITHIVESDTLLTYSLATTPVPIQASPQSGPPSIATLTFVLSAPVSAGTVTVQQIAFALPIGNPAAPDASDLTENASSISASVSSSGEDKWQIGPGAAAGTFVLRPASGSAGEITTQGLTVTFAGIEVTPIVGTARLRIAETARSSQSPSQLRTAIIAAAKFPYGFTAGNFSAEQPLVPNGGSAVLTWTGSTQAVYTLLWSTHSVVVSNVRRWISPPLTDVTTFILQVSAQQGGQTVELKFSTTVVVANPSIVANDLTVLKTAQFRGAVTTSGALIAAGPFTAEGPSTLKALSVTGPAALENMLAKTLSVRGTSSIDNLVVSNQLTAQGRVSFFSGAKELKPGNYTANTDGFVIGTIGYTGPDTTKRSWGLVLGSSTIGGTEATGGNSVIWMKNGNEWYMASTPNTFLLPVKGGTSFQLWERFWDRNEVTPWTSFLWVPLGSLDPKLPTVKKLSAIRPQKLKGLPSHRLTPPQAPAAPAREVDALIVALNRALKGTISRSDQIRLKKAFAAVLAPKTNRVVRKAGPQSHAPA